MQAGRFCMQGRWGARIETPAALAGRFRRTLEKLKALNSRFDGWEWGDGQEIWASEAEEGIYPFEEIDKDLVHAIERNAGAEEDGTPDPFNGYWMPVRTKSNISLAVTASRGARGGRSFTPFLNTAEFELDPASEPSLVSFDLLRSVSLIVNETWETTWSELSPFDIRRYWTGFPVRVAWMSYVSPHYAPLMTPPVSAVVEHRPNGGIFLAATRDVFETSNPAHLAVAREIEAALQPLNRVPNPNDAPYL